MGFNNSNFVAYNFPLPGIDRQPKSIPLAVDFTSGSTQQLDLTLAIQTNKIEFLRTIYVDNSSNPNVLNITMALTGQVISIPAFSQAYLPLILSQNAILTFFTATSIAPVIPVQLINISMPAIVWGATNFTFVIAGGTRGTDFSGTKPAIDANLLLTIPPNDNRSSANIQNQSADQLQVVLDDALGGASTIILLEAGGANVAGGAWSTDGSFKGRIRVYGPNAGAQVSANQT